VSAAPLPQSYSFRQPLPPSLPYSLPPSLPPSLPQSYSFNYMGQKLAQRVRLLMLQALLRQVRVGRVCSPGSRACWPGQMTRRPSLSTAHAGVVCSASVPRAMRAPCPWLGAPLSLPASIYQLF
jgi:hypothetical protein